MRKSVIFLFTFFFFSESNIHARQHRNTASPHVLVYKTRKNYRNNVPVMLSEDKTQIISFPAPGDVVTGSGFPLPVVLHKGYLLDKRGVGKNSAFLEMTYEQYSKLQELPPPAELYKMIMDRNPMTALYDCGVRNDYVNSEQLLNDWIDKKLLKKKCKLMK